MNITVKIKRLGKKKVFTSDIDISEDVLDVHGLIKACVSSEVKAFNLKKEGGNSPILLSTAAISEQADTGKVSFSDSYNNTFVKESDAATNALKAFEDGLFAVFIDDEEMKSLSSPVDLKAGSEITFIRLTFLSGLLW